MAKTVTAFGREWHDSPHRGLIDALVERDIGVLVSSRVRGDRRIYTVLLDFSEIPDVGYIASIRAKGSSLWLALVAAVEKMEGADERVSNPYKLPDHFVYANKKEGDGHE